MLVSVIIPYYKKKKYIEKTISSVINQTYKNIEIIIVYDDEDLDELEVIKKIQKIDDRIILLVNNKSFGAGESRNIGIRHSKGNYIAFLDADDVWIKNKIERQLEFMKKNQALISHTSYNVIDKYDNFLSKRLARDFNDSNSLLYSCDIGLSTVMIKKTVFENHVAFPKIKTKEDFVLWIKILELNIKIYGYNEVLTLWRKLNNSLSSSVYQKIKDGFWVYNKFMKFSLLKSLYYLFLLSLNSLFK